MRGYWRRCAEGFVLLPRFRATATLRAETRALRALFVTTRAPKRKRLLRSPAYL